MSSIHPNINNFQSTTISHQEVSSTDSGLLRSKDDNSGKLQGTTCVIGHGRNFTFIEELNYSETTFIDICPEAGPDVVADFDFFDVKDQAVKYDNVILLCSHLLVSNQISKLTGTYLSDNCLEKCLAMMKPNSHLYSRNIYGSWLMCECYRDDQEFHFIKKMLPIFAFKDVTQFSYSTERLMVFQRRTESIPSRIYFLGELGLAAIKLKQLRVANSKDCCGKLIDEPNSKCTKKHERALLGLQ